MIADVKCRTSGILQQGVIDGGIYLIMVAKIDLRG